VNDSPPPSISVLLSVLGSLVSQLHDGISVLPRAHTLLISVRGYLRFCLIDQRNYLFKAIAWHHGETSRD